ncbi:MAG: M15 family metallopeptidase [Blastocatellia bacterium]|nr:M15 family metallopeptidase [Blastocatellia bacterium]
MTVWAWGPVQQPPQEAGPFRTPELVELVQLDATLKLDIRYARKDNFLGRPVYAEARAFLQKPAAEALVRVQNSLKKQGLGLVVFDGYRPWAVTKVFWDAMPADKKIFVADPAKGSKHNRGCAIDLTLCDLNTGKPLPMPSGYDETSERAYPTYPGGTKAERTNRDILRQAMEAEGFKVYEYEWWHFDYKDWKEYPILNIPFTEIHSESHSLKK